MGSAATHTKYSPRWGGLSRGWILKETKQRFLITWKRSTGISEVLEKSSLKAEEFLSLPLSAETQSSETQNILPYQLKSCVFIRTSLFSSRSTVF